MLRSHEGWLPKCIDEEDAAKHHASGNWIGLRAVHFGTKFTAEEVSETGHQEKVVFVVFQGPQIFCWSKLIRAQNGEAKKAMGSLHIPCRTVERFPNKLPPNRLRYPRQCSPLAVS